MADNLSSSTERLYLQMTYSDSIRRTPDDVFPCVEMPAALLARIAAGDLLYIYWTGSAYVIHHDDGNGAWGLGTDYTPQEWAIKNGLAVGDEPIKDNDNGKESV